MSSVTVLQIVLKLKRGRAEVSLLWTAEMLFPGKLITILPFQNKEVPLIGMSFQDFIQYVLYLGHRSLTLFNELSKGLIIWPLTTQNS